MWSGLPTQVPTSAHDWGQVLTFQGKTGSCSLSVENLNSSQKEKRKGSRAAALKSSDAK